MQRASVVSQHQHPHLPSARAVPPETALARLAALDGHRRVARRQVGPKHGQRHRPTRLAPLQENGQPLEGRP